MQPRPFLTPDVSTAEAEASHLVTFRDSCGESVIRWPDEIRPSATVIVVDRTGAPDQPWNPSWRVLVQQRMDNGWWGFPGGRQEIGESILTCAKRECWEETGYEIALERLVSVDSDPCQGAIVTYPNAEYVQYTNLTFMASVMRGTLCCSDESYQVCWVASDALPEPFLPSHLWRLAMAQACLETVPVR